MEMPETLFRGTTQKGFDNLVAAANHRYRRQVYPPGQNFTTHWPNALGYAIQYSIEYSTTLLVLVLLEPGKYKLESLMPRACDSEHYKVLDPIDLNDGKTLVLKENLGLERLCEFPTFGGAVFTPRDVLDSVRAARERAQIRR